MTDALCLDMANKNVITGSMSLMIGYSNEMGLKPSIGTITMSVTTNSYRLIIPYVMGLYERIVEKSIPIRRLSLSCNHIVNEAYEQYDLFTDQTELEKDKKLQKAALEIKERFGKNALVRGMDLQEAGTTIERNRQIGGHKSGE
jgi:DNA polymerase V